MRVRPGAEDTPFSLSRFRPDFGATLAVTAAIAGGLGGGRAALYTSPERTDQLAK
jgi:hypothetical protein